MAPETPAVPDRTTAPSEVELAARADGWLDTGLRRHPADRVAAADAVRRAYAAAGVPPPERLVWLGSPEAGAVAAALLVTAAAEPVPAGLADDPVPAGASGSTVDLTPVVAAVQQALWEQGCVPGEVRPGASLRPAVRTRPWAESRRALASALGPAGFARHWLATAARPWTLLTEQVVTPVRTRLDAAFTAAGGTLGAAARAALLDAIGGQHDAAWLGAFTEPDPPTAATCGAAAGIEALAAVARSAGWWWAFEHVAVLTERPTEVHRDNLGRLHGEQGPALCYPDGFAMYAWRGMPIPPEIVVELRSLTLDRIQSEPNAEMRRVMMEHFGYDRYLRESHATRVHADETGVLWRVEVPGDEPLVMVEVVNSTPEPDGTSRTYFLRVPPHIRTARAGVAWMFGMPEEEYRPVVET